MSTYPTTPPLQHRFITVKFADISTQDSVWVVPGFRGRIRKISSVIDNAITVADAGITVEIGGVAVTGAALTVAFTGSGAGTVDFAVVPAGSTNVFAADQAIEVIADGNSTTTAMCWVTLELEPF